MRSVVLVLVGFSVFHACSRAPQAGSPCDPSDQPACASRTAVLACVNRTWAAVPCEGPMGCAESDASVWCDVSLGTAGQVCPPWAEGIRACTNFPPAVLQCSGGTWQTLSACPQGCTSARGQPDCVANVGGGAGGGGTGGGSGACDATNCSGCCAGGQCFPPALNASNNFCGTGGRPARTAVR